MRLQAARYGNFLTAAISLILLVLPIAIMTWQNPARPHSSVSYTCHGLLSVIACSRLPPLYLMLTRLCSNICALHRCIYARHLLVPETGKTRTLYYNCNVSKSPWFHNLSSLANGWLPSYFALLIVYLSTIETAGPNQASGFQSNN